MSWRALTQADLLAGLTSREADMLSQSGGGADDRMPGIIEQITAEIRGRIATWKSNQLSIAQDHIPLSFVARASAVARWRLMASIPNYQPSEARKLEYEAAEKFFEQVGRGTMRPEPPDDPIANTVPAEVPATGAEIVSSAGSRTGRTRMDGL